MGKGEPDFVVVNLKEIAQRYEAGEEVTIDNLKEKGVLRASGKRAKLPLKVSLGSRLMSMTLDSRNIGRLQVDQQLGSSPVQGGI